jgi:outer membrane lipoprotein carrier protein
LRSRVFTFALAALVLLAGAALAAAPKKPTVTKLSSEKIVAGVQARYAKINDIKAHFEQVTLLPTGRMLKATGEALFRKPNMIRWDFAAPEPQSIITDGQTMWLYEPNEKQVQVYPAGMLDARLRMGFFQDLRRLSEDFKLSAGQSTACCYSLELAPKPGKDVGLRHLTLLISREPMRVVEARVKDMAGNDTVIKFSDIKEDTGLPANLFHFEPPPGVRVIQPPTQGPKF